MLFHKYVCLLLFLSYRNNLGVVDVLCKGSFGNIIFTFEEASPPSKKKINVIIIIIIIMIMIMIIIITSTTIIIIIMMIKTRNMDKDIFE